MEKKSQNDKAYLFDIEDINRNTIRLENYKGKKVMVSFFRYASCPFCNLRVQQIIEKYDDLKKQGLYYIAFFESDAENIRKYSGKNRVPFPIIADPDRVVYKKYGVTDSSVRGMFRAIFLRMPTMIYAMFKGHLPGPMDHDKYLMPAAFLIEPDLSIHTAYYGKDIGDNLSMKRVDEWLRS